MSGHRGEADIAVARAEVRKCEGFRMPAHDDGAHALRGRRPQTSKENRGRDGADGAARLERCA